MNGSIPKNGGQIIKTYLIEAGCDIERFDNHEFQPRVRKKMRRYKFVDKKKQFVIQ